MNIGLKLLIGTAAIAGFAIPAAAQPNYPYPQQAYPQQAYPQHAYPYQQAYPQQGYGHQQQSGIAGIINQLLGNRYSVPDRTAVTQCATAAQAQASARYRPAAYGQYQQGYNGYRGQSPYDNRYGAMQTAQVTGITNVERRRNGVRVTGLMNSGRYGYGNQGYGYGNQGYNPAYANAQSDLSFRCTVDYRGAVTNLRVTRNAAFRRR